LSVRRDGGVAGQIVYTARVRYPDEESRDVAFSGSIYGSPGPIVMITDRGQTFVSDPERFGARFDRAWVLAFFGSES
jgi:hypothetical protein